MASQVSMLLDDIHEPADLRRLSPDAARAAGGRDPGLDRGDRHGQRRPSGVQPGRGRAHPGRAPGLRLAAATSCCGTPVTRPTSTSSSPVAWARSRTLRQPGGMSGYPSRAESAHDWIENSHASTALSYAHGIAVGLRASAPSTTGGWSPSSATARSPAGWPTRRSTTWATPAAASSSSSTTTAAPTPRRCRGCPSGLTYLRLSPSYVQHASAPAGRLRDASRGRRRWPTRACTASRAPCARSSRPTGFFEALGVRYAGPIDGHDIAGMEQALANAAEWDGPDRRARPHPEGPRLRPRRGGRRPAPARLQGPARRGGTADATIAPVAYTDAFTRAVLDAGRTPARGGGHHRGDARADRPAARSRRAYPDRFLDVGIAEQHAVTAAAGMAMGGPAPRGGRVLDLLHPRLRPGQPGRRACTGSPWSSPSTGPASPATTAQPPRRPRPVPRACRSRA